MKRDPRLRSLSSDHHGALVLARRLGARVEAWDSVQGAALLERFHGELEPHFQMEENSLLPALADAGEALLVDRVFREHALLRDLVLRAATGDAVALASFAEGLTAHVRFEERELFPTCEVALSSEVLDDVGRRCADEIGGTAAAPEERLRP